MLQKAITLNIPIMPRKPATEESLPTSERFLAALGMTRDGARNDGSAMLGMMGGFPSSPDPFSHIGEKGNTGIGHDL
ncbi:MAG: hypothetical protein OHK0050_23580 [Roseiflexaceae bacterium]